MAWSKEEVIEILQEDRHYDTFMNEFEGKKALHYVVSNIHIVIFNNVGGYIDGYFEGYDYCSDEDVIVARDFLRIALEYFRSQIR